MTKIESQGGRGRFAPFCSKVCCLIWAMASAVEAQTLPPPAPQLVVSPPDRSILITLTTNTVFATIANFSVFTNVTMTARFNARPAGPFRDDGAAPDMTAGDGTFTADVVTPQVGRQVLDTRLDLVVVAEVIDTTDPPPNPPVVVVVTNTFTFHYDVVPRPPNDNFVDAIKIGGAGELVFGTNNYASIEAGEPRHAQISKATASVWWTWSPAADTNVLIDLAGSSFHPILAVYTGVAVTNLLPVAASIDDAPNRLKAHVNFNARAGATYRIAVAGRDAEGVGNIRLRVAPGAQADTNGPVVTIVDPATESLFTNALVALSGTAKDAQSNGTGVERVFLQVNTNPPVEMNGTTSWAGQILMPPGTNIVRAFAQDVAGNLGPADTIVLRFVNPTNDMFSDAMDLTAIGDTISAINERASLEPGEPLHAGNEGGHSIWYRVRAPVNGTLFLSTQGSDFDTLLDLFTGDGLTNLVRVASNDDASLESGYGELIYQVISNQVYYVSVDGYGGTFGNVTLRYVFSTTERYFNLAVNQPLGGAVSPPSGLYLANSTLFVTAAASRDFEFVGWDGSLVGADNPLTLVMTQNYSLNARFRLKSFTEGFESGGLSGLNWTTSGSASWVVQSATAENGRFAVRSGTITDGQSSSLTLVTNLLSGTGAFDLRVNSEAGWDVLEFYLNGVRLQRWSGDVGWRTFLFRVPAGVNTLTWRYAKDSNFTEGVDAAFIDNLYLPFPDSSVGGRLSLLMLPDGREQVQILGLSGRSYVLQTSSDLADWSSISTNASDSGIIQWTDPEPAIPPGRFYRALAP